MKKIIFITMLLIFMSGLSFADTFDITSTQIDVVVDDKLMSTFDEEQGIDLPAFIYNRRTMLPLKKTFSLFGIDGSQISWNSSERSVTVITNENNVIWMQIDNKEFLVDGESVLSDVAPQIFDNRTFVPVAIISKLLGTVPVWDGESRTVYMNPSNFTTEFYQLTYHLNRLEGFTLPQYDEDEEAVIIKRWDSLIQSYDGIIKFTKLTGVFSDEVDSILNKLFYKREDFKYLDSTTPIIYKEIEPGIYLIVSDHQDYTMKFKFMNIDLETAKQLIESIKEQ